MSITDALQQEIVEGEILAVQVGLWRTAVLAKTENGIRCGLAASLSNQDARNKKLFAVKDAGRLHTKGYRELAAMIDSTSQTEASIGFATINALLPAEPLQLIEENASKYLTEHCSGKKIALIGHFPFIELLRGKFQNLWVFELNPRDDDLPAALAPEYLPQADVVVLTATTLVNHTFEGLMPYCQNATRVLMVGPSTPISSVMFNSGLTTLSGTIVLKPEETLLGIGQAGSMHALQEQGYVRQVTTEKV